MSIDQHTRCFVIRESTPADIPAIMRLKFELAVSDAIPFTVRAGVADWQRDASARRLRTERAFHHFRRRAG
jgi:hypothetical protein